MIPVVQIETNGVRYIDVGGKHYEKHIHIVISPKFPTHDLRSNMGGVAHRYSTRNRDNLYLKFVVEADPKSSHHDVPKSASRVFFPKDRIYISPMAVYKEPPDTFEGVINVWDECPLDKEKTRANYQHAAKLCMEHGYRLTIQTHLFAELP